MLTKLRARTKSRQKRNRARIHVSVCFLIIPLDILISLFEYCRGSCKRVYVCVYLMYSMCGVCICMLCNVCTCVSVCVMCIHVCMVYIMYACLHACAFHKHMKTTHTRQQARRLPRSRPRNKLVKFPAAVLQRAQRPACRGLATDLVAPPRRTANLLFWREMK